MVAFESDMPADGIEEGPQHEAEGFRVGDITATANPHELLGDFFCSAFVVDMLGLQPTDGLAAGRGLLQPALEGGKQNLFLVPMRLAQERQQDVGDADALHPVDAMRQAVRDSFELIA